MSETTKNHNANLVGINAHPIEVLPGIQSVLAEIPHNSSIFETYRKKADILTDVYGASSYENDPIAALIYESCLLNAEGKAVIISLESKFGNKANHENCSLSLKQSWGRKFQLNGFELILTMQSFS